MFFFISIKSWSCEIKFMEFWGFVNYSVLLYDEIYQTHISIAKKQTNTIKEKNFMRKLWWTKTKLFAKKCMTTNESSNGKVAHARNISSFRFFVFNLVLKEFFEYHSSPFSLSFSFSLFRSFHDAFHAIVQSSTYTKKRVWKFSLKKWTSFG